MTSASPCRALFALGLVLLLGACQSLEVDDTQFAIISVPMTAGEGGQVVTRPAAFFFEATGVRLATTQVGTEGCLAQNISDAPPDTFDDIDAGQDVTVTVGDGEGSESGVLVPAAFGGRIVYELPAGQSLGIVPGERVTVTIPGSTGGFPARSVTMLTVADFTPDPISAPPSATGDLNVTWSGATTSSGTAMYYSFQYASGAAGLDREIACVFLDDGSGTVAATLLAPFRQAEFRAVHAQRALITVQRVGAAITHMTSSLLRPVTITENP